jgi:hypothetical protein
MDLQSAAILPCELSKRKDEAMDPENPGIFLASDFQLFGIDKGAPDSSNGIVVPRPSERFRASIRTVPGYTIAVAGVGMLGEGITHGIPVSQYNELRLQPFIQTTFRSQFPWYFSLIHNAISPMVILWHIGSDAPPTKVKYSSLSTGPSAQPADRIGPVKDPYRNAFFSACFNT